LKIDERNSMILLALLMTCLPALSQPTAFTPQGFSFVDSVMLPVSADSAFDVMTGDVSPWWDHHFSEHPKALIIEPKAGGAFIELFDDQGNGVHHAIVTYADRGKRLRMEGPLGLAGAALLHVATWDYEPRPGGCMVKLTVNMQGQIDAETAALVAKVWHHFLYDGVKGYLEKKTLKR
jgi:hypothetical protein